MIYVEGFVTPVPTANRQAYQQHAAGVAPMFREFGVARMVEAWGDDVPDGKVNDFKGAVQARADETVVFSWFEYPSREARDAANGRMSADPRMEEMGNSMPFDGKRMIIGGFQAFVDEGTGDGMGYADGYLLAVPEAKREAYRELAARMAPVFLEMGAIRVVEAWADDVPEGKVTDYRRAVIAKPDETVVFSFVEWPSREARKEGWKRMMEDTRSHPDGEMPFDGTRMIYGGFTPILDIRHGARLVDRKVA
ncbi:DUF1428 family protein [Chelativorans sp. ZYF759]|uniref:DUF1428 domain-containing protein n=1 Tax=Chelativorans sp. ZYF759 TaxID=2692213 RepID=UPI00145EECEB|nr:DUF1428 domain-containing protein [Chelativorans sp. ZYF759]NMG38746.1 DUF1428 family protein [Chelativorans sp. ZYF759]